jgi:hypothetical protein
LGPEINHLVYALLRLAEPISPGAASSPETPPLDKNMEQESK